MKKIIIGIMAMVLAALGMQTVVASSASASGSYEENCIGMVTPRKTDTLSNTFIYGGGDIHIKAWGYVKYWDCLNGDHPRKIRPKNFKWCWKFTSLAEEHNLFGGVYFDAKISSHSDSSVNNPPTWFVQDNNTSTHCETQDIPLANEKWVFASDAPYWIGAAAIRYQERIGTSLQLVNEHGGELLMFNPSTDAQTDPSFEP